MAQTLQAQFAAALDAADQAIAKGKVTRAAHLVDVLHTFKRRERTPEALSRMQALIDSRREQIRDLERRDLLRARAEGARTSAKTNATCEVCGDGFRRSKKERRTVCHVCRPSTESRSVKTVSGGLPSLGRRGTRR